MKIEQKQWLKETGWYSLSDQNLKDTAHLVFLFGERTLLCNRQYYDELKKHYPKAHIIGCSTAGEIIGTQVCDDSLVATAVAFDGTETRIVSGTLGKMEDSRKVGKQLADSLPKESLSHVFVLSTGLHVNGSSLVCGLIEGFPEHVAVTGGLSGDQDRFEETVVRVNDEISSHMVAAIGFYGERIKIGYGSMGGWDSFGPDRLVTRSEGNILYEVDGKSALELYKKYLGDEAKGLPATGLFFPLSLRLKDGSVNLVRTILAVDEKEGSMIFAGDIPEGAYVRLMKANFERLIDGAVGAAHMTTETAGNVPAELAILVTCIGRKLVLAQRVEEEIEGVRSVLGEGAALTGFYSYGEICPFSAAEKKCELHNQTMTITTFSERPHG